MIHQKLIETKEPENSFSQQTKVEYYSYARVIIYDYKYIIIKLFSNLNIFSENELIINISNIHITHYLP